MLIPQPIGQRIRDFRTRLRAARRTWRERVRELEDCIEARDDYAALQLFLRGIPCGSADEALLVAQCFAGPARPLIAAPLHFGFDQHSVVDPRIRCVVGHCYHPAIHLPLEAFECLLFPQIHLRVGAAIYAPDFLVAIRVDRRVEWIILECNGRGHDYRGDAEREAALQMPFACLGPQDLSQPAFLPLLEETLSQAAWLLARAA